MSEDKVEYKPRGELRFVRLRSIPEDLIGYVSFRDQYIVIENPLKIEVETYFEEGRQVLAIQEYLPQTVIELKEVEFYSDEVLFTHPVKAEFVEQYENVSHFFYGDQERKLSQKEQKEKKPTTEQTEKVVSILEALAKKDKGPIH
jgi:hypothetical protein